METNATWKKVLPLDWLRRNYKERDVSANEGRQYAKSITAPFVESSAKQRLNVEEGFFELVRQIRKYNQKAQKERPPSPTGKNSKKDRMRTCILL